jgi:uncharacterized protein
MVSTKSKVKRTDVQIESGGERLAAWLYEGASGSTRPSVILGHGFAGTRTARLDAFAERFAAAGLDVIVFDYRHFGDSTGEPRQLLSIGRQQADWRAAIAWARAREGADPARVALWGSSFGGGHVIQAAAKDGAVAAIVAQVPFISGAATIGTMGPVQALRFGYAGMRDLAHAATGRKPFMAAAVGPPGSLAAMNQPDSEPGYLAIVEDGWRNEAAARILLRGPLWRPGRHAAELPCPALFVLATNDSVAPAAAARKAAARAPDAEVMEIDAGHFDVYVGDIFERVVARESEFLRAKLFA